MNEETARLRRFGLVMVAAFGALGGLALWRGRPTGWYLLAVAGGFLVAAGLAPALLRPVERGWMAFAAVLQRVMTTLILTLTYYLMVTPLGVCMRLFGKAPLRKNGDPQEQTYWIPTEEEGPQTRPDKPY